MVNFNFMCDLFNLYNKNFTETILIDSKYKTKIKKYYNESNQEIINYANLYYFNNYTTPGLLFIHFYNGIEMKSKITFINEKKYIITNFAKPQKIFLDKNISNINLNGMDGIIYSGFDKNMNITVLINKNGKFLVYRRFKKNYHNYHNISYNHGATYFVTGYINNNIYFRKNINNNNLYFLNNYFFNYKLHI